MRAFTLSLAMALVAALALLPRTAFADDCGLSEEVVPDFALVDGNPNSPTYGTTFTRDGLLGHVLVFYWAQAT